MPRNDQNTRCNKTAATCTNIIINHSNDLVLDKCLFPWKNLTMQRSASLANL